MNKRIKNKVAKRKLKTEQSAYSASPAGDVSAQSERIQRTVRASVAELAGEVRELAVAVGKMAELKVENVVAKIPLVGEMAAQQIHRIASKA